MVLVKVMALHRFRNDCCESIRLFVLRREEHVLHLFRVRVADGDFTGDHPFDECIEIRRIVRGGDDVVVFGFRALGPRVRERVAEVARLFRTLAVEHERACTRIGIELRPVVERAIQLIEQRPDVAALPAVVQHHGCNGIALRRCAFCRFGLGIHENLTPVRTADVTKDHSACKNESCAAAPTRGSFRLSGTCTSTSAWPESASAISCARSITVSGSPAMRATSMPNERDELPGSTRCEKTGAPSRVVFSTAVM